MIRKTLAFLMIFALILSFGVAAFASGEPSGEASGDPPAASGEPAVDAMIVIDGCAIAHDLSAVPVEEIGDEAEFIWAVSNGGGITYTDDAGVVWGIYRAGQAGVFEIVVSSENNPSPWTVEEQIWVGGSRIVELCVAGGKLTHVLTDELQAGPAFDVEIREVAAEEATGAEPSGEASGEPMAPPPSGGGPNMSREIPPDVADLPTIEAEYWVTTTEDRVGMEGPVFDDEGNLFVCSVGMTYPINYILQVDEDKNITTVWEGALSPLGLAFHENGKLFAVCREGELLIMDKDGTNVTSITPTYDGKIFSLNDLCFTPDSDLIVTDWQGTTDNPIGGIYVLTAESGYQETRVLADKLVGPNGVSISPDGNTLWVGMTNEDAIYRINLVYANGDVTAANVELVYQNSGAGNPDSNEVDAAGNLYQAMIQGGRVLVLNSEGTPIANVIIPEREQGSRMMSSNLAIKPGANEAYLLTAGFGEGSHIYVFETLNME